MASAGTGVAQTPNIYQQSSSALTSGINAAQGAARYQPMMVSPGSAQAVGYQGQTIAGANPITAQNVQAGQLASTDLQPYLNPYTSAVYDTSLAQLDRTRQQTLNQVGAQATAARAFGGSRMGLLEAETNRGFADQAGQLAANLNLQGFNTAQQAAQSDIASRLQASLANQGASLTAQQATAGNTLQQQLANQASLNTANQFTAGAQNAASQFNAQQQLQAQLANQQAGLAGSQQRLSASGQLGGLANTAFGIGQGINQQQYQQGLLQQAINQQLIDAARQQYGGFTNAPTQAIQLPLAAVGSANMGQQTQTSSYNPGLFGLLGAGLGAASLF